MPELNEKIIKALPVPPARNKVHWFSGATLQGIAAPAGFGMCITANGSRSFILNYRHGGAYRRITIGKWPTWTALLAMKEARELRRRIDKGEDPLVARHEEKIAQVPVKAERGDLEEQIAAKARAFLDQNIEPFGYCTGTIIPAATCFMSACPSNRYAGRRLTVRRQNGAT